ncbi:hypothetical protein Tco_0637638 [Tanacetum coccineum]
MLVKDLLLLRFQRITACWFENPILRTRVLSIELEKRSRFGINKWYQSFALRNFDLEDIELESSNSGPTAKLSILKLEEYEMWVIRIKQYFHIQDYALWEVIENGDSRVFATLLKCCLCT